MQTLHADSSLMQAIPLILFHYGFPSKRMQGYRHKRILRLPNPTTPAGPTQLTLTHPPTDGFKPGQRLTVSQNNLLSVVDILHEQKISYIHLYMRVEHSATASKAAADQLIDRRGCSGTAKRMKCRR
jgi:hypothetical protein